MRTPPRLVARTLMVTFITVAVILTVVFIVITLDVRDRVRAAETDKLKVSEKVFTALETKRQQDQVAAMATLAENPTLKARARHLLHGAALQRIIRRTAPCDGHGRGRQARDANAGRCPCRHRDRRTDFHQRRSSRGTLAVGPEDRRARGRAADIPERRGAAGWRVPCHRRAADLRRSRVIGALVAGTSLDANYAQELSNLSAAGVVITVNNSVVARMVPDDVARDLRGVASSHGHRHARQRRVRHRDDALVGIGARLHADID
mgnify:CR=1 FL=1